MLQDVVSNFGQEMEQNWTKCKKEICFIKVEGKIKAFLRDCQNSRDCYSGHKDPEQIEKYKL